MVVSSAGFSTIMCGGGISNDVGRFGAPDLVRFGGSADEGAKLSDLVDRNGAASAATAVVGAPVRGHFHEVGADVLEDLPRLFDDPASTSDVARIVIGDPLLDGAPRQLQAAALECSQRVLHEVDDLWRAVSPAEGPREVIGGARGVTALADENLFRPQPPHFFGLAADDSVQHPVGVEKPVVDAVEEPRADGPGASGGGHHGRVADQGVRLEQVIADRRKEHVLRALLVDGE